MLGTQEQMDFINNNFLIHRQCCTLSITTKCKFRCEHCCQSSTDNYHSMSRENILKICKQLKGWFLEIMGGEAFLEPELLEYTIDKAKENGAIIALATTGFWIEDNDLCRIARKADYLILPIDPWHRKVGITHELIDKVCDKLEYDRVKILYNFLLNTLDESMPKHKLTGSNYPLISMGRGENISKYKKILENNVTFCHSCGLWIESTGKIHANCEAANYSCLLGDILKDDLNLLLKKCKRPAFILDKGVTSCYEICQKVNNHILDKSWDKILFKKIQNNKVVDLIEKTESNIKKYRLSKDLLC